MTAYEMRISDCSSDVCSSDLGLDVENIGLAAVLGTQHHLRSVHLGGDRDSRLRHAVDRAAILVELGRGERRLGREIAGPIGIQMEGQALVVGVIRSEEHTSELQSLMRISYAVFCLKKKK